MFTDVHISGGVYGHVSLLFPYYYEDDFDRFLD
jgi:hypothetical protein